MPYNHYTRPQLRARIAALEIAADHLTGINVADYNDAAQYAEIVHRLLTEANRLRRHVNSPDARAKQTASEAAIAALMRNRHPHPDPTPPPAIDKP